MSHSYFRVNDYISSGLNKDLVDPDGGVNAEKKKAELGFLSKNKDKFASSTEAVS